MKFIWGLARIESARFEQIPIVSLRHPRAHTDPCSNDPSSITNFN